MWCLLDPLLCFGKDSEQSSTILACITACDNMPACDCRYHLYVWCSPDACLLAWHVEPEMMSVQVCSESTSHAEAVQKTYGSQQVEYGKLVDLLSSRRTFSTTTLNRTGNDVITQKSSSR